MNDRMVFGVVLVALYSGAAMFCELALRMPPLEAKVNSAAMVIIVLLGAMYMEVEGA